jgi:hypothetical protein
MIPRSTEKNASKSIEPTHSEINLTDALPHTPKRREHLQHYCAVLGARRIVLMSRNHSLRTAIS